MRMRLVPVLLLAAMAAHSATMESSATYRSSAVLAPHLSRGVGARAVGMGEAFTAVADDASALYWNPGALSRIQSVGLFATHEIMGYGIGMSCASVGMPSNFATFAVGVSALTFGFYDVRDINGKMAGSGSFTDMTFTAGMGTRMPGISGLNGGMGASVEYIGNDSGDPAFGLGVGAVVEPTRALSLGLVFEHMTLKGNGFPLPAAARLGCAYSLQDNFLMSGDVEYGMVQHLVTGAVGMEYSAFRMFSMRMGYRFMSQDQGWRGLNGLVGGFGFNIDNLSIDYAAQLYGDMATTHRMGVVYNFGKDAHPRLASADQPTAPENDVVSAYTRALGLYEKEQYPRALDILRKTLTQQPEFWQGWQLAGNCLLAQGDREKALRAYRESLKYNPQNMELKNWLDNNRQ